MPLYPVSRGRNWGLGSRVPTANGCAVLDLGRMDAITAFDDKMGTITLEPGVTFSQVQTYLSGRGASWFLPAIGGPADASVIGNLAERGDGAGPTGERAAHACALQVMLPDGSLITTGFGMFAEAAMTRSARAGPGPSLDGLFIQSGMGILVGATLFLSPVPAHLAVVRFTVTGRPALAATLDTVRALVRDGVFQANCVSIWNATKLHMRGRLYPWAELNGRTPLPLHERPEGQSWYMVATLHVASSAIGQALASHATERLAATGAVVHVADDTSHPNFRQVAAGALGSPDDITAASIYWRKRSAPGDTLSPEADRCGMQWLCLALPLDGASFVAAVRDIEDATLRHSFEAVLSGCVASPRSIHLFAAIIYDRDTPGDDHAAQACHDEILVGMAEHGIHPMRLGIQAMGHLADVCEPYANLMRKIRSTIDPHGIVAPGRYEM